MIVSALVSQCRREYNDVTKSHQAARAADGVITLFKADRAPVVESSYTVYFDSTLKTETTHYTLDKDSGDLTTVSVQNNGVIVKMNYKYANFRDLQWVEAINHGVEALNSRGFFRQVVRNSAIMRLSANIQTYSAPSACVDLYEVLLSDNQTTSGTFSKLPYNWKYEQDANKLIVGSKPARVERVAISYLRNLQTYSATSATLDVLNDWVELVKLKAGAYYFRNIAAKIATQGNASIDEGHFSFTNARTMANDLEADFERLAQRKKPTRPPKDIQYAIPGAGVA